MTQLLTRLKECVLCSSVYTTEKDWAGRENLVLVSAGPAVQTVVPTPNAHLLAGPAHVAPSTSQSHHEVSPFVTCVHISSGP